ncbi:SDR family oxidoreductase [Pigmentiphaga aceris]|uniref:SDR family oxidoreductase n=1 Tax=Pigmentiphaga aceris TaxID=1940612 RepID=A0A5C0AVT0_9BURK|nr:SDR family oxidoreductase [Pigmentiphaga aceris]QEI06552.1 SDR family oxidoreductase [Pigmentiphaga aceris]
MKLSQTSVVLTGASGGIGSATARLLIHEGAKVLLVGRSKDKLMKLASELGAGASDRSRLDALVVDITTDAGRAAIRDVAQARNVNVLINNAGVPGFGPSIELSSVDAQAMVNTNLLAPMLLTSCLLPQLMKQPRAQVINVGSTLARIGVPGFAAYGATKAGLRAFSESLRRELAETSVKVQYFAPRAVDTQFNDARATTFNTVTGSRTDSVDKVAAAIIEMIRSERIERGIGWIEQLAARLNALCPGAMDGAFTKHRHALQTLPSSLTQLNRKPS